MCGYGVGVWKVGGCLTSQARSAASASVCGTRRFRSPGPSVAAASASALPVIFSILDMASWPAVCACLPQDDCRYVLCGLSWEAEDGHTASKQVFVLWSPSQAPIKTKLVYSASTGSLKQALQGKT